METDEISDLSGVELTAGDLTMRELTEVCGGEQPSREPSACTNMISLVHHSS